MAAAPLDSPRREAVDNRYGDYYINDEPV